MLPVNYGQPQPKMRWRLLSEYTMIDPRSNHLIAYWDLVTTICLVFIALVTPVEVSFLTPPAPADRWTGCLLYTSPSPRDS